MKNKILLMIADGVGDRPCQELGYRTPLEYAKTPNLDKIASQGSSGIMDLHGAGIPVGTDLGHMILFGYSLADYPGRGPIEAAGNDMDLQAGDIALRCNFATVDENKVVLDRRAGRIRQGAKELAQAVNGLVVDGVEVIFKAATEHRAVLILRGQGLSDQITDTDPKDEGRPIASAQSIDGLEDSKKTAEILNKVQEAAYQILDRHEINMEREKAGLPKANYILTRGAGKMPRLEKTAEKYKVSAACIASETTVLGVAKLAGFEKITHETFTGNVDTNIKLKAETAVKALKDHDFVVLHFKAPDLMGHDNKPKEKVQAIEIYDQMVGHVFDLVEKQVSDNLIMALAADHSTPCERREHSGDPVPVVISGKNIRKDGISSYDEISASRGGLCRISGNEFFNILFDYLEATKKEGN